ncbi:undecaprenyl-diphosphate phosphatase [Paenirhodobacter populi]|uniref:Undecaprenyl-diphosphatase n=1 Tax=Paenirhodobacter populi TaxID=2306993 RepID=A0A443IZV7_9RHOB|nr:undecaprenyl-diphosphate phosphatase [Sinirhodobacter populi]RWR13845.1 undecaprenyl-diphosphate phosphatase [Sinirhodobacter populi]RWR19881.1 undecaprenyl-diphosphate phosphatase [Sinirhodobacter populi]RWR28662.1 undecaprenyl-diphosphate phosphatase [Sinirhodobacter populi]RWR33369.1 undecaprenyl-diphosphate phosphatase [Sinirhodobacter populi]
MNDTIVAGILGLLEGLTEFLPVSSTGHILLAGHFLGFHSTGKAFEVVIQLGAILAILWVYGARLIHVFASAPQDPAARRFITAVLVAFLPAVVIGVLAHDFIKTVLFETPKLIAIMLIVGGVILLFVDHMKLKVKYDDAMGLPVATALKIGFIQCLAMIPGVSRSGSTIVGAMLLGVSKRAAAEFSFFLSIPTMTGAFAYDLYKNRDALSSDDLGLIVVGFIAAFIAAVAVVHWLLGYVSRHGYALFGWWRIIVGTVALIALMLGH